MVLGVIQRIRTDHGITVGYPSASGTLIVIPSWDRITGVTGPELLETGTAVMIGLATFRILTPTIVTTTSNTMEWDITGTAGIRTLAVTTDHGVTRRTSSNGGLTVMFPSASSAPRTTL